MSDVSSSNDAPVKQTPDAAPSNRSDDDGSASSSDADKSVPSNAKRRTRSASSASQSTTAKKDNDNKRAKTSAKKHKKHAKTHKKKRKKTRSSSAKPPKPTTPKSESHDSSDSGQSADSKPKQATHDAPSASASHDSGDDARVDATEPKQATNDAPSVSASHDGGDDAHASPPVDQHSANDDYPDNAQPLAAPPTPDNKQGRSDDSSTHSTTATRKRRDVSSTRPTKRHFFKRTHSALGKVRDKLRTVKNAVKRGLNVDGGDIDVSDEALSKLDDRNDVVKLLHRAIRAKHKRKVAKLVTYLRTSRDGLHTADFKDEEQSDKRVRTLLKLLLGLTNERKTKESKRFEFANVMSTLRLMQEMKMDVDQCVSVPKAKRELLFRKHRCTVPYALAAMSSERTSTRIKWLCALREANAHWFDWNRDVLPQRGSGNLLVTSYAELRIADAAWYETLMDTLGCSPSSRRNGLTLLDYIQRDEREGQGVGDASFRKTLVDVLRARAGKTSGELRRG